MTALQPHLPALPVLIPLFGAVVSAFMRRGTSAWAWSLIVTWLCAAASALLLAEALNKSPISYAMGSWRPPIGIEYRIDVLNAFILFLVSAISAVIIPFARRSVGTEIDADKQAWFYTMYLLCLAGLLGIAATGDAFNVFVFLEVSSLATYVLIAMGRDRRALVAAYRYLILGTIGASLYVIGIGLLYLMTGTLNMADMATRLGPAAAENARPAIAALGFITVGISLKLALFPLHVWLPSAYAYAPSFATTFLAATATKVAVYVLIRYFFSVFGAAIPFTSLPISDIVVILSIAAMFIASLLAVFESNVKRMLAFSSVAQIGYITLGISLANLNGLTGSIVHLFNHAVMKAALFVAIGAVVYRCGAVRLPDLSGIGRKMPITMGAFVIAGLSIIGAPGTAGFVSKWYLAVGALDKGWWPVVFLILASSMLAIVYIGKVVEIAWFRDPSPAIMATRDPPLSILLPLLALTAATIYFGIDTEASAGIARTASQALLGGLAK
jgi:multicomponent Na+:H+ antiporter subunit D